MNPEGNRRLEGYNANPRIPDGRYPPNYPGMGQGGMQNMDNYIMQLSQMMYQPYPYMGFPYPNGPFFNSFGGWRQSGLGPINSQHQQNPFRSSYNQQNQRVVPREIREKSQAQVINLQSDEEEPKQKNVLVPPNNNANKQSQKQAEVINLEDNSQQKKQKKQETSILPKSDVSTRTNKLQLILQKIQSTEAKNKTKQVVIETKTKIITKIKHKETKIQIKEEKSSKERRRKVIEAEKNVGKTDKEKQIERNQRIQRIQKKKSERVAEKYQKQDKQDKQEKLDKQEKTQRGEKNQKNKKSSQAQPKAKGEEGHTKQIAKYLQSHGEIRPGKQFQSDIPAVKVCNTLNFNFWLEQKRRNILKRQIGTLTY